MEFNFQSNSLMNSLKFPKVKSMSPCLTKLFPIYQNNIWWMVGWSYHRHIVPPYYIEDCQISYNHHTLWADFGPLHVLWQVSFGCWISWSISSWQEYYKSVFFPKAELLFLSLNNWGLNFLQNECSQSSQIYLSPEKLRKMFTF